MKKLIYITITVGAILLITIAASLKFLDPDKVYKQFVEDTGIKADVINESDIEVYYFPAPHVKIKEIKQQNKLEARDIKIAFSVVSIILFNPKITDILLNEVVIHLDHDDIKPTNHDELISELLAKNMLSVNADINNLKFVESDNEVLTVIKKFNIRRDANSIKFSGRLEKGDVVNGIFIINEQATDFILNGKSEKHSFEISEKYINNKLQSGVVKIQTTDLANNLLRLMPAIGLISNKFYSDQKVNISFNIVPAPGGTIAFEQIDINSDSIRGTGNVLISKSNNISSTVKFNFDTIDLSARNHNENGQNGNSIYGAANQLNLMRSDFDSDFYVKEIKLSDKDKINEFKFNSEIKDDILVINECSGILSKQGSFKFNGSITKNAYRSLFDGVIALNHGDLNDFAELVGGAEVRADKPIPFSFFSKVKFNSVDLSLQDFILKTYNGDITGNISAKFIGDIPRINSNITFSQIDIDKADFPLIPQAIGYISGLLEGMKEKNYITKFIPIRKIGFMGNYDITFDKLLLNNKLYKNVNFNLGLSPGKISVEQLYLTDGSSRIGTSFALEAQSIKPVISVIIHDGDLSVDFLSAPGFMDLKQKILSRFDPGKINVVFRGNLSSLKDDKVTLGKVAFAFKNDKNLIEFTKLEADICGGRVSSSGSILLEPYNVNFVYALNSAQMSEIAKLLPAGFVNPKGVISASGIVSTNGEKLNEQLYNLYTKSQVITKDIFIKDLSLDDFITKLGEPTYELSAFNDDVNKMLLTGETHVTDMQASIELSKGTITAHPLTFKTKYAAGAGRLVFDLYNFNLDASSLLSFYLIGSQYGKAITDSAPAQVSITVKGDYFNPKKEATANSLIEALQVRSQR